MAKLGILGGMGPMATQLLYKMIIENTEAACDQEHIDMIILNHAGIPDRTAAIKSGMTNELLEILLGDVKMLEDNGCTAIAIPCNTSHYFYKDLQGACGVTIINMISSAIEDLKAANPGVKKIGILATDGTLYSDIYRAECERLGLEAVYPEEPVQKIVMDIIYNQIKRGERGNPADFAVIDEHLRSRGAEGAILACTELSCYRENHGLSEYYIDALESLCKKSITLCGGKIKENK